jgi:cell division protein FtsW
MVGSIKQLAEGGGATWLRQNLKGDRWLWTAGITLFLSGIPLVYSASVRDAYMFSDGNTLAYLFKHTFFVSTAIVIMYFVHRVPYVRFAYYAEIAVYLSALLLLVTNLWGVEINHARRWLEIPFIQQRFQPSELAKVSLVAYLSLVLANHLKRKWTTRELLLRPMVAIGIICSLIYVNNGSTAIILAMVCLLLMYVGKIPLPYLGYTILIILFFGLLAVTLNLGNRDRTITSRIQKHFDSDLMADQPRMARIALARGGLFGQGTSKSKQRRHLPQSNSDYVFAIGVEEYGSLAGLAVISLFLMIVRGALKAIRVTQRPFGGLLSVGLMFVIVFQAFVNMAVTVGLLPVTGQPLPFISQGGTSLWVTGLAMGMIISVSRGEADESLLPSN